MSEDFVNSSIKTILSVGVITLCGSPFERIKVLLQTQPHGAYGGTGTYTSHLATASRLLKEQGELALCAGSLATTLVYFPTQALNFVAHTSIRQSLSLLPPGLSRDIFGNLLVAVSVGGISVLMLPLATARSRQQTFVGSTAGAAPVLPDAVLPLPGIASCVWEFGLSFLGTLVYRNAYNYIMSVVSRKISKNSFLEQFLGSTVVTSLSSALIHPLDTVRQRVYCMPPPDVLSISSQRNHLSNVLSMGKGGGEGLYAGLTYGWMRVVVRTCVSIIIGELQKSHSRGSTVASNEPSEEEDPPQRITTLSELHNTLNANSKVAIDFSAQWCGPCKKISPLFHNLQIDYPEIKFVTVDVDESPDTARQFGVDSLPMFAFCLDGVEIPDSRVVGADVKGLYKSLRALENA